MIQQHHLGTQGRALGCNDGITKTRADVHGMFPTVTEKYFFKASNSKSNMERKSLLLLLIPLYMVYFGINILTYTVPRILDSLERDSFLEIVVIFGGMGATILAAVFSVLFGILWARKIILGEDTGVI